jgi:hypothetical protein
MSPSRVFILASQPLFAQGVESLLSGQPGIDVIGVATVGPDVFAQVRAADPNVVIIETTGQQQSRLVAQVLESVPGAKVVGLTLEDNRIHTYYQHMKHGRRVEDLLEAVREPAGAHQAHQNAWAHQSTEARRGLTPDGLRLLVLFQGAYGQRILDSVGRFAPPAWTVESWRVPSTLPLMVDDPHRFLPAHVPEADLVLSLGENPGVADLVSTIVEGSGARALIAPVDNPAWLPAEGVRHLRARMTALGVAAVFPTPFCSLTEHSCNVSPQQISFEDPWIGEFARYFGRPVFRVECEDGWITNVAVERDTPCGCARFIASQLPGVDVGEAVAQAGRFHRRYPCLASEGVEASLGPSEQPGSGQPSLLEAAGELMCQAVEIEVLPCQVS